jgi:hypothetical protein
VDYIDIIKQRKVIDGFLYNKYFIDAQGKEVGLPTGVGLTNCRGICYVEVKPNKKKYPDSFRVFIAYSDKATQEQAFKKAINVIGALSKRDNRTSYSTRQGFKAVPLHPAFDVDLSEVPAGVAVNSYVTKGVAMLKITVSCFDRVQNKFNSKKFYAGTSNTWRGIYPHKLKEAISLREESLKLYNELTKVN